MNSYATMILAIVLSILATGLAGIVAPVAISAPIVAAPPAIGYTNAVPYNIPPYASRVDINTRNIAAPYISAPYIAAPAAAPIISAPGFSYAAAAAAPIVSATGGLIPTGYAGNFAAPLAQQAYAAQTAAILG